MIQVAQKSSKAEGASARIYVNVTGDGSCAFGSSKSCAAKGLENFWVGCKGRITAAQMSKVMVCIAFLKYLFSGSMTVHVCNQSIATCACDASVIGGSRFGAARCIPVWAISDDGQHHRGLEQPELPLAESAHRVLYVLIFFRSELSP